jgi:ankyrin repeat protein
MGKNTVFFRTTISGFVPQSIKTFAVCIALAASLAGIFWYGDTRTGSTPEPFLSSPLVRALRHRDHAAFVRELDRLPSIDTTDHEGMTALLTVACCGDLDALRCVLERKPNLDCVNRGRGTPLMAVLSRGDADAARLLLRSGADLRILVDGGDCALLSAIRGGSDECVAVVLDAASDSPGDLFLPGMVESPLNCAASDDAQEPMTRRLLAAGVDPNRAGANGQLPLVTAILSGSPRSAALLLRAGANADLPDGRGRIARGLAGREGCLATAFRPRARLSFSRTAAQPLTFPCRLNASLGS